MFSAPPLEDGRLLRVGPAGAARGGLHLLCLLLHPLHPGHKVMITSEKGTNSSRAGETEQRRPLHTMARLALLGQALLLSNSLYATLYSPINGGGGLEQSDLQVGGYQLKTNIINLVYLPS